MMRRASVALLLSLAACGGSGGVAPAPDVPAPQDLGAPKDAATDDPAPRDDASADADVTPAADASPDAPDADAVATPDAPASDATTSPDALAQDAPPDLPTAPDVPAAPDVPVPPDMPAPDASPDVSRPDVLTTPDAAAPDAPAPSLCSLPLLPMNGARVTSQRPTLQFARAPGLRQTLVELCRERSCASPVVSAVSVDDYLVPPSNLAPGVWFWRLTPRSADGATCTTATWEFVVPARSLTPGRSWGVMLDVNGDGYGDLAVATTAGDVQLFHGTATGIATTAATTLTGLPIAAGAFTAPPVPVAAGDLDGDGFVDLAIGLPAASDGAGEVRVHRGGPRGVSAVADVMLRAPDGRFGHFGASLAGVGDIEGDGFADLVVGAPRATAASATDPAGVAGRVYAFHGSSAGVRAAPTTTVTGPGGVNGAFGAAVAGAGDVNSDRFPDVIVGAPGAQRAYVFTGTALGLSGTAMTTFTEPSVARYGEVVGCAGDVDGDNHADVFVAGAETARRVELRLAGAAGNFAPAPVALTNADTDLRFGRSVASADVNADGFSDLLVAAPGIGFGSPRLFVYAGGAAGVATTATFSVPPPGGVAGFAEGVASVGDVNRDGASDFVSGGGSVVFVTGAATGAPVARTTFPARARIAAVASSVGGF